MTLKRPIRSFDISCINGIVWLAVSFILFGFTGGCSPNEGRSRDSGNDSQTSSGAATATRSGRIETSAGTYYTLGETIDFEVLRDENAPGISSVTLFVDGVEQDFSGSLPGSVSWHSGGRVGTRQVDITVDLDDGSREIYTGSVVLASDITPVRYTYRVINSYPHDITAYTQGLIYDGGYFYESTGRYGHSTLRKVDPETGGVLRSLNLDRNLFGEGLCLFGGQLYQLTWQSNVGFVYDKETFRLLRRFHYDTEGWGLTTDGTNLLMTDGSHYLYVMEPGYFTEVDRIEVYDQNGPVDNLNELEFIDGIVYANIFPTDLIVMFERETGRVTGVIDLAGLLDSRYHHSELDVLNGIAYDREGDRLFVTGKNWPRMFHIVPEPRR